MPLLPYKDRTIRFTPNSEWTGVTNTAWPALIGGAVSAGTKKLFTPTLSLGGAPSPTPPAALNPSDPKAAVKAKSKISAFDLVGPTYINFGLNAGVADESGLNTNSIEPWFIKAIPIQIRGESYLGMYDIGVHDKDVQNVVALFTESLQEFSFDGTGGTKEPVVLEIANNPPKMRRFIGYIKGFTFSEDVKKPYFLDYQLDFIGLNLDRFSVSQGKLMAARANNGIFNAVGR